MSPAQEIRPVGKHATSSKQKERLLGNRQLNPDTESLRVAILRISPETTISAVLKGLASFAVGSLAAMQGAEPGMTKLDFSTVKAARKLQDLIRRRGGGLTVNGKKVEEMTLQVSVLLAPQALLGITVLLLTHRNEKIPNLGSDYVKFILRQNDLSCPWVGINHVSRSRIEVHFRD